MKKTREPSFEDRLDYLDTAANAIQCEIVRCCYLLQQIKCLVRNGGAS